MSWFDTFIAFLCVPCYAGIIGGFWAILIFGLTNEIKKMAISLGIFGLSLVLLSWAMPIRMAYIEANTDHTAHFYKHVSPNCYAYKFIGEDSKEHYYTDCNGKITGAE